MNKVSIVIPTRNEKDSIGRCLDSIICCTYNKDLLNVYVVDGLSDDGTDEIVKEYSRQFPFIHFLINENITTPYALNKGIMQDDADVKIILGGHAEIDKRYIDKCIEAFDIDSNIGCAGGVIENISENNSSEIISLAMSSGFGVGNAYFRTGVKGGFVDTVAFGAYKKEVFERVGLFDEELTRNQDDEFNFRISKAGFKIYLSHEIKSKYFVRTAFKKLFGQYFQYGYWKVYVNKKHKTITTIRQLVPFFFVCFLIFGLSASFIHKYFFYGYVSVLFLYAITAFYSGFLQTKNIFNVMKIIYAFIVLHIGYGFGYLNGLIHFYILGKKPSSSVKMTR